MIEIRKIESYVEHLELDNLRLKLEVEDLKKKLESSNRFKVMYRENLKEKVTVLEALRKMKVEGALYV